MRSGCSTPRLGRECPPSKTKGQEETGGVRARQHLKTEQKTVKGCKRTEVLCALSSTDGEIGQSDNMSPKACRSDPPETTEGGFSMNCKSIQGI